jgi:hypothetical protein
MVNSDNDKNLLTDKMKTKKVIAREFLFFIGAILFVAMIYGCLILNNVYQERRQQSITNKLYELNIKYKNFLSRPLKVKNPDISQDKLDDFANFLIENPNATQKYIYDIIIELENDSTLLKALYDYAATTQAQKYKYKKEQNLKFPEFFVIEQTDIDSIEYFQSRIEPLQNDELKAKDNILSTSETKNYTYTIGLWVFTLTFVLRYLVYATKWSIRIIKNKD